MVRLVTVGFLEGRERYNEYGEDEYENWKTCGVRWALYGSNFAGVYSTGQEYFNTNIIDPTIKNETLFTTSTLPSYYNKFDGEMRKLLVSIQEESTEAKLLKKTQLTKILSNLGEFYNLRLQKIFGHDDYWILNYLAEHLAINTALFQTDGLFEPPTQSDKTNGFLFFTEDRFAAADPRTRRVRKLVKTII